MKTYYVYILSNLSDTVYYVGVTNDLVRRVWEHKNKSIEGFTEKYNLDRLMYYESCGDIKAAIAREKQLKGWTIRKKKDLILSMNPEYIDLYETIIK